MSSSSLVECLTDSSRPSFLLGEVPPAEGTAPGKCLEISSKFAARSQALANDGFVVYDIQDEPGRVDGSKRPFPFRQLMDSSPYAALLARTSGKPCLVYKCIADDQWEEWIQRAVQEHGHSAIQLVGRPSSSGTYQGPTLAQAMEGVQKAQVPFGCVCIAERHTLESAKARGKDYPTEHSNMMRKQEAGAQWFVSQAVYDVEPTVRLLRDYAALCRQRGVAPRKVLLTFAPASRPKTIQFIKWLGVSIPAETEEAILQAERPAEKSVQVLCSNLQQILHECTGLGIPLGINCESVSIYKAEIDAVHELFRRLQGILLDGRGSPWKVQWVDVQMPPAGSESLEDDEKVLTVRSTSMDPVQAGLVGAIVGGALVATGVVLGSGGHRKK